MMTLYVPTYTYTVPGTNESYTQICDVRGDLTEACNAARQVDLWIMGWNHMYSTPEYTRASQCQNYTTYSNCPNPDAPAWCFVPMDPEGILSSIPAVLTTFIGMHFGNVLIEHKVSRIHSSKRVFNIS